MFRKITLFASVLVVSTLATNAFAATGLTAVTPEDFEKVSKEFSANFSHHSVQGAAPLGAIFGFEVGLVAGQSPSPESDKIAKRQSSGMANLYHGGILAVVSVPLGFTGELIYTPKLTSNDMDFQGSSLALKWTLDQTFIVLPFNLAFRAFMSDSKLNIKQSTPGIDGTLENKNNVQGLQVLISPSIPFVEPYAGIGYLQAKDSLSFSGTGTIFGGSFPVSTQSQDISLSSTQYLVGVTANLLFIKLGAEYTRAFETNSITAKLAFGF